MKILLKYFLVTTLISILVSIIWNTSASVSFKGNFEDFSYLLSAPEEPDSLKYPYHEPNGYPFSNSGSVPSSLYLQDPSNITREVEYDPESGTYYFNEKVGTLNYRNPTSMSLDEYRQYDFDQSVTNYWKQRARGESFQHHGSLIPKLHVGGEVFDKIFGSNTIDIRPQGSAELIFGLNISKTDNPILPEKLRRTTTFDFQEKIQMNVTGQIGDKLKLATNYNTEATFDFENKMNIGYEGKEDEILQKIEAGDVTLPLTGSLITGSQSLFGIKTELKFGRLTMTNVFSQQKGKSSVIEVQGGAQTSEYEIYADQYEANKHFFLAQYFYNNYDKSLKTLPVINSPVNITRIEVWVTNKTNAVENVRNIVAFMDLAEYSTIYSGEIDPYSVPENPRRFPANDLNSISDYFDDPEVRSIDQVSNYLDAQNLRNGVDFDKIESARMLSQSEYTINPKLGFISLNSALNSDEVLAVAYEYTAEGKTYRVGEFSNGGTVAPNALILKLLKGTSLTPKYPTWDLMMKNVYAIGAYQINSEEFYLDVMYRNDKTGTSVNYLTAGEIDGKILLKVLNLDNLDNQLNQNPDGVFDFVEGITINSSNGRIFFPVLEPFGEYLEQKITEGNSGLQNQADLFVFNELYDSTQTKARQMAEKNKFFISGTYQSKSGSDISLNALNIPQGSVNVTAGGIKLTENVDYTVDYNLGRVKIINQGLLESGTPIKISLESNSLFNIQSKTLLGTHLDYKFSNDFNIGGTILNLTERPLTQKVSIGDEPISNTIWGLNSTYRTEAPLLTKLIDKLPFLETKEMSSIIIESEFAHLIPGHSKAIDKVGIAYIDDFEGSKTSMDIKSIGAWSLASTPQKQTALFPETSVNPGTDTNLIRSYGFNRAKIAWYVIDPLFLRNISTTPDHLKNTPEQKSHFVREIFEQEIFPLKESPQNVPTNLAVLNLSYYPEEKGPYNYDVSPVYSGGLKISAGIDSTGLLNDPETRWGGIMREIQTNDFEAANIEYIEFWMMDPFVYDTLHNGGDLYFNLGDISEDILKDSRKTFENGLPGSENVTLVDTTAWGRVPKTQSIVNSFDNSTESRLYQDVGLDGLQTNDEKSFFIAYLNDIKSQFGAGSDAYNNAFIDPSNDDYHYYRGSDYDEAEVSILDRYKKYNSMDGNSPTSEQSEETYPTSATSLPNSEDVNRDNTLSEAENYYQYKVSLRPEDMYVGNNYISDMITGETDDDGIPVNWYQFKIPIQTPEKTYGDIQDFKSIRFVRMFLKNFDEAVTVRFASLDLVRGEWRKYNYSFVEGGLYQPDNEAGASFDITAVNIEENGKKSPVNYVLPPGISRVIDPSNPQLRQLNEQAMVLKVCNLKDGDAKAAYKTLDMDVRQYKRLQMFVHCEAVEAGMLEDKDLTIFIRLGSDYQHNFYEYEIPLVLTPAGTYTQNDNLEHQDRYAVWPVENNLDLLFEVLQTIKQQRNNLVRAGGSTQTYNEPYSIWDGENYVTIVGNPNLSNVRTIMIGVRNRNKDNNPFQSDDDGMEKCAEIWLNELRLTDFDEKGGWAANTRITARLADFGTVTVAGSTSKPGFGSIEKKVNERDKEEVYRYDIASNLEMGKFFPEKTGIKIPMYIGYSEGFINPEYNPLDPDIPLKTTLNDDQISQGYKDTLKTIAQDYTQRKSLNFTNVKVGKGEGKPRLYNISNVALSYGYNEQNAHNVNTEYNNQKMYRGALTYNFNTTPKNYVPLKGVKSKFMKSKHLKLLTDFNFSLLPSQLSFMTDMNRSYNEKKLRNLDKPDIIIEPTYSRDFTWNRIYDLRYDITKSLKFDFSANNQARLDEPTKYGYYVSRDSTESYEHWKDSVMSGIRDFGRNTSYHHDLNLNYSIPINKIPLLNWITASARYTGTYDWNVGPQIDSIVLGNTIKNSSNAQFNTQFNMTNLYNKVGYLKQVNQKFKKGAKPQKPKTEKVYFPAKGEAPKKIDLEEDIAKTIIHKLETDNVTVKVYDSNNKEIPGKVKIVTDNKITFTADDTYKDARIEIEGEREVKETLFKKIVDHSLYVMMSVKNVSGSYSQSDGTLLPGYLPKTNILGMDDINGIFAPGWQFISGIQDPDFPLYAIENDWLTRDNAQNNPVMYSTSKNLNLRAQIEPINGFRIDVTANKIYTNNITEYYVADSTGNFKDNSFDRNRMETGNFNMSYFSWNTAFIKRGKKDDYSSRIFDDFLEYRKVIADRLASRRAENSDGSPYQYDPSHLDQYGFPDGYGQTAQEVLIPAFLAAYAGKTSESVSLNPIPEIPMPNWRITYDGLAKIKLVKRYVKTASLSHAFRSTYTVNSFSSNMYYEDIDDDGFNWVRESLTENQDTTNFLSKYDINGVSINEQLSPLIGLDLTWNNSLITKIEIKKTRNINLSFSNNQITEVTGDELIIGSGYRFNKVPITFKSLSGTKTKFESDLNVRADLSIRKNLTIIRKITENYWDLTAGQTIITLKLSADYVLSERFNVRLFFDKIVNRPHTSIVNPTSNTNFGISVRFTLAG